MLLISLISLIIIMMMIIMMMKMRTGCIVEIEFTIHSNHSYLLKVSLYMPLV